MFLSKIERMILRAPEDDKGGGGGGGDDATKKENETLKARIAELEAASKKKKTATPPPDETDDDDEEEEDEDDEHIDLVSKAKKNRDRDAKRGDDQKALEAALRFTLDAPNFLKNNATLLPKDITDIFTAADKESFDSAKDKADAIKAGVIKSFFSVQSNLDLLTPGVKSQLEDYLKLTNTGRQDRASAIFDTIFEPAFEMLKRVKKAEALGKGHSTSGSGDDAYKEKLMRSSRKHHLGVKE